MEETWKETDQSLKQHHDNSNFGNFQKFLLYYINTYYQYAYEALNSLLVKFGLQIALFELSVTLRTLLAACA